MNRVLFILSLVSVLGSQGKSVPNDSYGSQTFVDRTLRNDSIAPSNVSKDEPWTRESSSESTTVSQPEDQDPVQSSETIVYNRFAKPSVANEDASVEEDEPEGPPDHAIPHSEHEEAGNVATKPKYAAPGEWAKPPNDKDVPLDFVPTKLYAQVRKTHTLRRLPRTKAIETAESEEEKENAARLREVVKNSKVNTVYTEEGYEDAAYDHAGHVRDADFNEGYARKLHEHLDLREKSGDRDGEEGNASNRKYKNINPAEFKDFDDDNYRSSELGNAIVNPKAVAEEGREKLQEDLEKEAEEMERGIEISKVEKVPATTDRENSAESKQRDYYDKRNREGQKRRKGRKPKRPSSSRRNTKSRDSREKFGESESLENVENSTVVPTGEEKIAFNPIRETVTLKNKLQNWPTENSALRKYEDEENSSPNVDANAFKVVEENPTTVSYGQLFWDYFKALQNQAASTEIPLILESTPLDANLLQASSFVDNGNNFLPYTEQILYEQATTTFPIIDSGILSSQTIVPSQTLINPEYSQDNARDDQQLISADEPWQPLINSNEPSATEAITFPELYNDNLFISNQEIPLLNSQKSLDSNEGTAKNFDSSLFNPMLNSLTNRKPRYKITIRHKPKKQDESPINQETLNSNPAKEPVIKSATPNAPPVNENYMKVLTHLQNENRVKSLHHPNGLQQNNFASSNSKNNFEDLTRMRPPLPQNTPDYYYNYIPRSQTDIDGVKSNQNSFQVSQRQTHPSKHRTHAKDTNSRGPQIFPDASQSIQRPSFNRRKNSPGMFHLMQPTALLRNDLIRHKESMDYVNRAGNRSKQARNVLRPFRQTVALDGARGIRAKRRERRFVGGPDDDESHGIVKGLAIANNGTSNRGEIERATKNPRIERNCSQKVTQGLGVGPVTDTSEPAKQSAEKKSRYRANDRGEGSRAVERESSGANGGEGRNGDLGAPECDDARKGQANVADLGKSGKYASERGGNYNANYLTRGEEDAKGEAYGVNLGRSGENFLETRENSNINLLKGGEEHAKGEANVVNLGKSVKNLSETQESSNTNISKKREGYEIGEASVVNLGRRRNNLPGKEWNSNMNILKKGEGDVKTEASMVNLGKSRNNLSEKGEDSNANILKRGKEDSGVNDQLNHREKLLKQVIKLTGDVNWTRKKRNAEGEAFKIKNESKTRGDLQVEASKTIDSIDSSKTKRKLGTENSGPQNVSRNHEKLFQEADKVDPIKSETNHREDSSISNNGSMQREELLNAAPEVAEEVIEKEINDRFNSDEEENEEDEKKVEVEVPEFDYVEELIEEDHADATLTTEATVDLQKYPFYSSEKLPTPSALKYAIDPRRLPRKTYGAMEFYNSRDAYKHCDEVESTLEVLPEDEEPVADGGPKKNLPRLRGLGDKLDCFKAKYFDDNPFDNPLFLEKKVEDPVAPAEMDSKQFASRIMIFPKENDDYVVQKSSRRPESYRQTRKQAVPARYQKGRHDRYKNYPRTRSRTRKRPQESIRMQSSQTKYNLRNSSRRPQKSEKRPVAAASEISALYAPYESQVYEDVMGTIKNLASSYQVHEETTLPPSDDITLIDGTKDDKSNSSANSTSYGKKEKGSATMDIAKHSSNADTNINRSRPANYRNRIRGNYKRIRVPQKTRQRIQRMPKPVAGVRTVKRRRKVRVYKRDLSDDLISSREGKLLVASFELDSEEIKRNDTGPPSNSDESNYSRVDRENLTSRPELRAKDDRNSREEQTQRFPTRKNSSSFATISKPIDAKRKSKVPKSVATNVSDGNGDSKKQKSEKVVYTIRDRIRYSKPKAEARKVGKFEKEEKVEEDSRRREPKYNYIRRKNPSNTVSTTAESISLTSTDKIHWTEIIPTTTEQIFELGNEELAKENRHVQYLTDERKNNSLDISGSEQSRLDHSKHDLNERAKEQTTNETGSGYAVYENVNEGEITTTQRPQTATPSEFFNLKTFLKIDPPGYTGLSSEDFKKSFFSNNGNNSSDDFKARTDSTNSNTTANDEKGKEDASKTYRPSYFSEEESSEKVETNAKVQSSTESSEESSAPSKESESREDRTFFSFTSRPSSPAENYEDVKYSDLGPRVNKPSFFHPSFALSNYGKSRSKGSTEESAENSEEKEEYVFPWYRDKKDQRKRKWYGRKSTGEHEYPWERRERLAREEKRKKEDKRKRLAKSFMDDEDDEGAFATKNRRTVSSRGKYRFGNRNDRDASEDSGSDNAESSSESRPTMKYSSRYNSRKSRLPLNEKSQNVRSRSVEEISRSIKKALEGDSVEKSKEKGSDSSEEKKPISSYRSRGISRGMIVPEDVTLASIRRTGKREKSKAVESADASIESKNSSEFGKDALLENSESQIAPVEASLGETGNSTNELNTARRSDEKRRDKKRRRPLKNPVVVEATTKTVSEANRARRRQKSGSTTPATILSTSAASTTSASMVIRRRNSKSSKDSKKNDASKMLNKSTGTGNETETTTIKTGTENRSRGRKKSRTNEILNEGAKNLSDQELSTKYAVKNEHSGKVNDEKSNDGEKNVEIVEKKLITDESEKKEEEEEESSESKQTFPNVKSDEQYDIKEDEVDTGLSDFDKSDSISVDDDYEYGSILKKTQNCLDDSQLRSVSRLLGRIQFLSCLASRLRKGQYAFFEEHFAVNRGWFAELIDSRTRQCRDRGNGERIGLWRYPLWQRNWYAIEVSRIYSTTINSGSSIKRIRSRATGCRHSKFQSLETSRSAAATCANLQRSWCARQYQSNRIPSVISCKKILAK